MDIICIERLMYLFITVKVAKTACIDSDFRCGYWASIHECEINPAYFVPACPYSCKNPCECTVYTKDTACDCLLKAKHGECEDNPTLLGEICEATCDKRLAISCPGLSEPSDPNAVLSSTDTHYLTTVDQLCKPGWESLVPAHKGRKLCDLDAEWIYDSFFDADVECARVDCGPPSEVAHGTRVYTSTLFESTVTFTCDLGFRVKSGDLIRICNETAEWSGYQPGCEVITCPGPPVVPFAARIGDDNVYNSVVEFSCNVGYKHEEGDLHRRCQLSGEWSGERPVCNIVHCPMPVSVAHTSRSYTGTHYLSRVHYMCLIGYNHTSGDLSRQCLETQQWTGAQPVCTIVSCGEPPLIAGAKSNVSGYNYSHTVEYECYLQEDEDNLVKWTKVCEATGVWTGPDGECSAVRRKFEATPVEASGSVAFGTVAMSILIVILVCIIILDIPTVYKQSKYLRKNLKNFRKMIRRKLKELSTRKPQGASRLCTDDMDAKSDMDSMCLSTLSLQTTIDDDGLRSQSRTSVSREAWSTKTSTSSHPDDIHDTCLSEMGSDDVLCDLPEDTLITTERPLNMQVSADIEVYSLD